MAGPVHYELYVRRVHGAPWTLEGAMEERVRLTELAEQLMAEGRAAAVRGVKETFDAQTGQFDSVTLFSRGAAEVKREKRNAVEDTGPLCVSPSDLYTVHARERIARLLSGWLRRKSVTVFELLHRADLLEELEATGVEIQHALQKVAIPEAQARGMSVHEVIRQLQALVDRAIARVIKDAKAKTFAAFDVDAFAAAAERLTDHPERHYILAGGVARSLAEVKGWRAKAERLITLAEAAPAAGRGRTLALSVLEPSLSEILGISGGLGDLFGAELDLGGGLAALTCLAAPREAAAIRAMDPSVADALPPLSQEAARLAHLMELDAFEGVRAALGRRVVAELNGPRRLHPHDPEGEIALLRALAMVLTASAGRLLSVEDVQAAFIERSKRLVASDFVSAYLAAAVPEGGSSVAEAHALCRLTKNVAGVMNKRAAARWLSGALDALRFEKDVRAPCENASTRLAALAELHRAIGAAGLVPADALALQARVGQAGGWIEEDSKLCALLASSSAPLVARCSALAGLALGESAPLGPVADRARGALTRLMRDPAGRATLSEAPETAARVRDALASRSTLPPVDLAS